MGRFWRSEGFSLSLIPSGKQGYRVSLTHNDTAKTSNWHYEWYERRLAEHDAELLAIFGHMEEVTAPWQVSAEPAK